MRHGFRAAWIAWGLGLAACGGVGAVEEAEDVAGATAHDDARALAAELREAARKSDVYAFRTKLFREHARAHGARVADLEAAAVAVIEDGGVNGFDGLESLVVFYVDALVRRRDDRRLENLERAFHDAGGVRFSGTPAPFPHPLLRMGTGLIPSGRPETLRALLEAAGRTPASAYGDACGGDQGGNSSVPAAGRGGYEVWLGQAETHDALCGGYASPMTASDYCTGSTPDTECREAGAAGLTALSVSACISQAFADELAEPSTPDAAWEACQQSMVDQFSADHGGGTGGSTPTGGGLSDSTGTSSTSGASDAGTGNCSCSTNDAGGGRPKTNGGRPGGRPDSGPPTGNANSQENEHGHKIEVKQKGGSIQVVIIIDANKSNDDQGAGAPPAEPKKDEAGWIHGIIELVKGLVGGKKDSADEFATISTTPECQAFEDALSAAAGHRRLHPDDAGGQPWNDPRKSYPAPESTTDAADALGEVESCGADSASFNRPGVCGLVTCGGGYLSMGTSQTNCCQAAASDSNYARLRETSKSLCESVVICEGDRDCCSLPTAPSDGIAPRTPPVLFERFFTDVDDPRRMASDSGEGAPFLSRMEEVLLAR